MTNDVMVVMMVIQPRTHPSNLLRHKHGTNLADRMALVDFLYGLDL